MQVTIAVSFLSLMARSALGNSCNIKIDQKTKSQLLSYHNDARQISDADPLSWSDDLYCSAQAWANRCVFEHSKGSDYGENIGTGYGGGYEPLTAVKDWWDERSLYKLGDGFSDAAGHYTQLVWKDTAELGCAVATCTASQMGMDDGGSTKSDFVVCQYKAPGNVQGLFKKFVSLPQSNRSPSATGSSSATSSSTGSKSTSSSSVSPSNNDESNSVSKNDKKHRKSHWSPHQNFNTSKGSSDDKNRKHSINYNAMPIELKSSKYNKGGKISIDLGGQQATGSKKGKDCDEGTKSGTKKDGTHWTHSWKSWSSSSRRSPKPEIKPKSEEILVGREEPLQDGFFKREALSLPSKKRLHKRRRAVARR